MRVFQDYSDARNIESSTARAYNRSIFGVSSSNHRQDLFPELVTSTLTNFFFYSFLILEL
jgi:hypothetical protein